MSQLEKLLGDMVRRISELERRNADTMRHGTVEEVDAEKHRVRLRLKEGTDGTPFIGPWVPYGQVAGALKVHAPPTVGQQMTAFSPTGDHQQAVAMPLTWSDNNPSPSQVLEENVITYGNARIELRNGQLKITVGSSVLDVTTGHIEMLVGGSGYRLDGDKMQMSQKWVAKGGFRPAHYVGGKDTDDDLAVDGNDDVLI